MKSFKVNPYITLVLKDGRTEIYVNNELFLLCKKLIIQLDESSFEEFEDILSIDELVEKDSLKSNESIDIPPEIEFWGHCSNIQAWTDNNYNPSLIHSNLAFPLLKKLTDVGSSDARIIFKEEILKRIEHGNETVLTSLLENQYLEYFTRDELQFIYENFVLPLEPSSRLLVFLRAFTSQQIFPVRGYYEKFVKEFITTAKYKEKLSILKEHGVILSKNDFLKYFKIFSSEKVEVDEEDDRFNVLANLVFDLEFYGFTFDNTSKINYLLRESERESLLYFLNRSKYPYTMLNFEEDEVRRRVWQEKLYYDLYNGHVGSIELICENPTKFLKNIDRLKIFKNLKFLTIIFSQNISFSLIEKLLVKPNIDEVKLKAFIFYPLFPFIRELDVKEICSLPNESIK
ncbi:MAG: hypothetical protein ACW96X_10535 [Promethearchaeota archaeon]